MDTLRGTTLMSSPYLLLSLLLPRAVPCLLAVAALVQVLPVLAAFDARWLSSLYGLPPLEPMATLLLRHRAVLLALVGVALGAGALSPSLRPLALGLGLVSKVSFLVLAAGASPLSPLVTRVARVDAVTATLLVLAALAHGASPGVSPRTTAARYGALP